MSLLTTSILKVAYREVCGHDIEWKADAFWQAYINLKFPPAEDYMVACQSAPTSDSRKKVDITVKRLRGDDSNMFLSTLLLCEAKRSGSSKVKEAEKQVLEYAREYLEASEDRSVYCMTAWGTKARCWIYYRGGRVLTPMFGKNEMGSQSAYVDANDETRAGLISASIAYIKEESTTWPGQLEFHQSTQSGEGTAEGSSASNTQPGYSQASGSVATSSTERYSEWVIDDEYQRRRRFDYSTNVWEWQ